MIRKNLYFTDKEVALLTQEAAQNGLTFSEHVRRILDHHLEKKENPHVKSAISGRN